MKSQNGNDAVLVEALRTPVGKYGGVLKEVRPDDLSAYLLKRLVEKATLDPALIEDIFWGCANQAGEDNRNVGRMASLLAGFPHAVPACTINRLCGSSLEAINQAARAIWTGEYDVVIAGGVESMSRAPYVIPKNVTGETLFGNLTAYDTALGWRFPNPLMEKMFPLESMGETAENIAVQWKIRREDQDAFALLSHQRASEASRSGRFADEIVPVEIPATPKVAQVDGKKGEDADQKVGKNPPLQPLAYKVVGGVPYRVIRLDEGPRHDTSLEKLSKLKPAFRKDGTVTAGNSSSLNDGAAAILMMSEKKAKELGYRPYARVVSTGVAGVDPRCMGIGPVPATRTALTKAGLSLKDIGLVELNEAFAAQSLAVLGELDLTQETVNVNGGAIALGHPLGCSGARIMTTLIHEMRRRQTRFGLATMCIGVGQGIATIVELVA
jgi:acetyl-CoA acetyltransferase family protein